MRFVVFCLIFFTSNVYSKIVHYGDFFHFESMGVYQLTGLLCPQTGEVYEDYQSFADDLTTSCSIMNTWVDGGPDSFPLEFIPTSTKPARFRLTYFDQYDRSLIIEPKYTLEPCPENTYLDTEQNACVSAVCSDEFDCFHRFHEEACVDSFVSDYNYNSVADFSFGCNSSAVSAYLFFFYCGLIDFSSPENTYTDPSSCVSYYNQYHSQDYKLTPSLDTDGKFWLRLKSNSQCWLSGSSSKPPNGYLELNSSTSCLERVDVEGGSGGDTGGGDTGGGDTGGGGTGGGGTGGDTGNGDTGGGDTGGDLGGSSFDDTAILDSLSVISDDVQSVDETISEELGSLGGKLDSISESTSQSANSLDSLNSFVSSSSSYTPDSNPFDGAEPFFKSSYSDGFSGIWVKHRDALEATSFMDWTNQFKIQLGGGESPSWEICFNLGSSIGDFGCHSFTVSARVWAAVRIFILFCAGLLARRLVFGG